MKKYFVFLFAIATMISACSPAEPAPSLTGTTWKLTSYGRVDSPESAVSEEGFITFSQDGKFTGIGACNRFEGDYEVKNAQIILSSIVWDVGGNVSCPEPQMSQESGVWEVLKDTAGFKIEDNTLTITRKTLTQGELVLVFEAVANSTGN